MGKLKVNMEQYFFFYLIIIGLFIAFVIGYFIERKLTSLDQGFNSVQLLILGITFCLGFLITIIFTERDK